MKRLNYIQKTYKVKWWYPTHEMAVLKGGKFAQFILLILLHGRVLKVTVVELSLILERIPLKPVIRAVLNLQVDESFCCMLKASL